MKNPIDPFVLSVVLAAAEADTQSGPGKLITAIKARYMKEQNRPSRESIASLITVVFKIEYSILLSDQGFDKGYYEYLEQLLNAIYERDDEITA